MSTDPVKKRGRPKKVISDPVEVILSEGTKKTTTRSKSTTASSKTVTAKPTPPKPPPVAAKFTSKPPASSPNAQKPTTKAPPQQAPAQKITQNSKFAKTNPKSPVTPETSKILSQVRELPAKTTVPPGDIKQFSNPSPITASANPSLPPRKPAAAAPSPSSKIPPPPKLQSNAPASNISQPPPPKPTAKIPIASLNSQSVDNITTRGGARPNTVGSKNSLPPNYRPVARKVTMAIVALPVLLVTSWVLYERLILGEERKLLVKPGLAVVEGSEVAGKGSESSKTT